MSKKRRAATAYHEAGHAVVAVEERLGIRLVTIVPNEELLGFVLEAPLPRDFKPDIGMNSRIRNRIESEARVCFAGHIAQKRAYPRSHRLDGRDIQRAVDLVSYLVPQSKVLGAYLNLLYLQAENLVDFNWQEIEAVANALLERDTISGSEVRRIVMDTKTTA